MPELSGYAVFLHDNALETLGDCVAPYLCDGPHGRYVSCREVDTSGGFVEMLLLGCDNQGRDTDLELIIPAGMIKMIVSARAEASFGFAPRSATPLRTALPVTGPTAAPAHAPPEAVPDAERRPAEARVETPPKP